jgi:hypothetical protein
MTLWTIKKERPPGVIYLMPSRLVPGGWRDVQLHSFGTFGVRL